MGEATHLSLWGQGFFLAMRVYYGLLKTFDYFQKLVDIEGPGKNHKTPEESSDL